jgi:hypothetical protein
MDNRQVQWNKIQRTDRYSGTKVQSFPIEQESELNYCLQIASIAKFNQKISEYPYEEIHLDCSVHTKIKKIMNNKDRDRRKKYS